VQADQSDSENVVSQSLLAEAWEAKTRCCKPLRSNDDLVTYFFFLQEDPIYLQSVIIILTNGGKN
jgi:hypothetical protein